MLYSSSSDPVYYQIRIRFLSNPDPDFVKPGSGFCPMRIRTSRCRVKVPFYYSLCCCSYASPTKSPEFGACAQTAISSTNSNNRGGGTWKPRGAGIFRPLQSFLKKNNLCFSFLLMDNLDTFLPTCM